jgi:hypothetical protein
MKGERNILTTRAGNKVKANWHESLVLLPPDEFC